MGLALIALAFALFLAEAFVTSYGFLTLGGAACLILGGLMLVESPTGFQRISLWLLIPVALATAGITFFLVGSIVKAHRGKTQTGGEALVGAQAVAVENFTPSGERYVGMARAHGELWKAVSPTPVATGQEVRIKDRQGLTLLVQLSPGKDGAAVTDQPIHLQGTE